jgi:triosephosphate isomerase (TIM)
MPSTPERRLLAANWKMNLDLLGARTLSTEVVHTLEQELRHPLPIVLAPAFPFLTAVHHLVKDASRFGLAAQNLATETSGAYTGEVSGAMLASVGCSYVLIGHSERRQYYQEDDLVLNKKLEQATKAGLRSIFCLGETLAEREAGNHFATVEAQLNSCLPNLSASAVLPIVAYEPVWAIGTGVTASPAQAEEMHAYIRNLLTDAWGSEKAEAISLLYGGSVTAANAAELFACANVDGGLVGGASLKPREFAQIAHQLANARSWS